MDETHVGGKPRKGKKYDNPENKPKPGRGTKKAPVIGAVEHCGNMTAKAVPKDKMKGRHLRALCVRLRTGIPSSVPSNEHTEWRTKTFPCLSSMATNNLAAS